MEVCCLRLGDLLMSLGDVLEYFVGAERGYSLQVCKIGVHEDRTFFSFVCRLDDCD